MNTILKDQNTSSKIKALLAARNIPKADVAEILGVTVETIRNRMKNNKWDIGDIEKIASAYMVEKTDLI
jgi:transcription initiation factor TFIIIB Brf1 subunit/transcription initiation factor TFIIB